MEKISATIRQAIIDSGETQLSIATAAKLDHSQLSRFMRSERTLRQEALERLAEYLGLELRPARKRKKG